MSDIKFRLRMTGGRDVKRELRGVTGDVEKSDKSRVKSADKANKAIVKSERDASKTRDSLRKRHVSATKRARRMERQEAIAASREILEDFRKAERKKRQELEKTLQRQGLSARERIKAERKASREIARLRRTTAREVREARSGRGNRRDGRRRRLGTAAGAAIGAGAGVLSVASGAQSTLGIRSQEEIVSDTVVARQNFIRTAVQAGLTQARQEEVFQQATRVGRDSGIDAGQILAGIGQSQEQFANLDRLLPNLEFLANVSRATGSEFASVVGAAGELERQFGLSGPELNEAIALISRGAEEGSLSLRDFAESQSQAFSGFSQARGVSGVDAIREFQAVAQALRAGGLSPETARTRQSALTSTLSDRRVQARLRRAGVNVLGDEGNLRNLGDIASEIASNGNLRTSSQLRRALGSQEAQQALGILTSQERAAASGQAGALSLRQRQNVSAEEGRANIEETIRRLNADASGRAVALRAGREASVFSNSAQLIDGFASVAGPLTELQDKFPALTQAVEALTTVLGGAGLGAAGGGALSSALGGAAGGAVAGGAAAGGSALGGAAAGTIVGGLAVGGAAGTALGLGLDAATGDDVTGDALTQLSRWFSGERSNPFAGGGEAIANAFGFGGDNARTRAGGLRGDDARATEDNTTATTEQTRAMRDLPRAISSAVADGVARGVAAAGDGGTETPASP